MEYTGRLTNTFVKLVERPGRYGDARGGFGLSLLVKPRTKGGFTRAFSQRLRIYDKVYSIGLGAYPRVTLEEAREAALLNARTVDKGGDPRRPVKSRAPTFEQAAEQVIASMSTAWKDGGKTRKDWESKLQDYAYPLLRNRHVNLIDTAEVFEVLRPIWSTKRPSAEKVRRRIGAVMTWAVAQGYRTDNPVDAVKVLLPKGGAKTTHFEAFAVPRHTRGAGDDPGDQGMGGRS